MSGRPKIVATIDIVGKMVFEEIVALEEVADDWDFVNVYVVRCYGFGLSQLKCFFLSRIFVNTTIWTYVSTHV